jgi:Ca2+-binding EF-hand superfamily protein
VFHRELDKNHNGFVTFEEFDNWFKTQSSYGGEIVLAPKALGRSRFGISRLLELPPALQRFFGLLDLDLDERISPKEWSAVKPLLGNRADQFSELDKDLSGYLSMRELKPLLPLLVVFDKALKAVPAPKLRPLPLVMAAADLNADTRLDSREIKRALGRISPFLVRHSTRILRDADMDGDGSLAGKEVR